MSTIEDVGAVIRKESVKKASRHHGIETCSGWHPASIIVLRRCHPLRKSPTADMIHL